tara:strand:+ start:4774 stop:5010 length:237 start_codon:yes stop_codon:yes gene_type:complete
MQRRNFLGVISAGLFGAKLPASEPVKQVLVSTSFKAKKYTVSSLPFPGELEFNNELMARFREAMLENLRDDIDREIMG